MPKPQKKKKKKNGGELKVFKTIGKSNKGSDGLRSRVAVCSFPKQNDIGTYIPICYTEGYCDLAQNPVSCERTECPDYAMLPLNGIVRPHLYRGPEPTMDSANKFLKIISIDTLETRCSFPRFGLENLPQDKNGAFIPICSYRVHRGIAIDTKVCNTRQCKHCGRIPLDRIIMPYQEREE